MHLCIHFLTNEYLKWAKFFDTLKGSEIVRKLQKISKKTTKINIKKKKTMCKFVLFLFPRSHAFLLYDFRLSSWVISEAVISLNVRIEGDITDYFKSLIKSTTTCFPTKCGWFHIESINLRKLGLICGIKDLIWAIRLGVYLIFKSGKLLKVSFLLTKLYRWWR